MGIAYDVIGRGEPRTQVTLELAAPVSGVAPHAHSNGISRGQQALPCLLAAWPEINERRQDLGGKRRAAAVRLETLTPR